MGETAEVLAVMRREMEVRFAPLPARANHAPPIFEQDRFILWPEAFRFETPGGVGFFYRVGEGLVADVPRPELEDEFRVFLRGTVFGAIAWLNNYLPLHASAVAHGRSVIAFTADSGGGKSTLAAALATRGFEHVCDDTLVLDPQSGQVMAMPDGKPLKLWEDAFEVTEARRERAIGTVPGKFYASIPQAANTAMPLTDLVFLEFGNEISLEPLQGGTKAGWLLGALYRDFVHEARNDRALHARFVTNVIRNVRFWRGVRPKDRNKFSDVMDFYSAELS